jgi:IclR family KDG regulon transcriptional repressor
MPKEKYLIQSVRRALAIIDALSNHSTLGVTELSEILGLHKSTVFGLLSTLEYEGYVCQNTHTGKYELTLKLFEIGSKVFEELDLRKIARPYIEQIVEKHHETAHLVVPDGPEVIYIDKVECTQSMRICSNIGKRLPFHCTGVGKVILANMPKDDVEEIIKKRGLTSFTNKTITDYEDLLEEMETIRVQGYSIDDEEIEIGLKCVAAPIRDISGKVIAATSVAGPTMRMTEEKIRQLVEDIKIMNERISAELGYCKK